MDLSEELVGRAQPRQLLEDLPLNKLFQFGGVCQNKLLSLAQSTDLQALTVFR